MNHDLPAADSPLPVLGIDVSKLTLDLCLLRHSRPLHARFENSPQGHRAMLAWLAARDERTPEAG